MVTLFVLYLWILVPFAIRFGFTGKNVTAWHGYAVMFFGIYASISERKQREREMLMATMSVLSAVFAYVFCGALLFCAWSGTIYAADLGPFGFGAVEGWLCSGVHYNITGMIVISLCMMCVMGVGYHRNILLKLFCLIPAVMSMAVIVLTQSRTSRYALLAVLAAAAFDGVRRALCRRNVAAGLLAAVLAGAVVLGGGYWGADRMTRAAVAHYNQLAYDAALQAALAEQAEAQQAELSAEEVPEAQPVEPSAEETTAEASVEAAEPPAQEAAAEPAVPGIQVRKIRARVLANTDGSFSDRTDIWRAVFMFWRDNPKMMMIGNGVNQTGHKIGQYISWTDGIAVHDAYLAVGGRFRPDRSGTADRLPGDCGLADDSRLLCAQAAARRAGALHDDVRQFAHRHDGERDAQRDAAHQPDVHVCARAAFGHEPRRCEKIRKQPPTPKGGFLDETTGLYAAVRRTACAGRGRARADGDVCFSLRRIPLHAAGG